MNNDKLEKNVSRGFKAFGAFFIGSLLVGLSLLGLVIYVAVHFLAKVW